MTISWAVLSIGLTTGLTYAILGVGLNLIYKSARFINFAHGELGVLSALLLAKGVYDWGLPYWLMFPLVLAMAATLGALIEIALLRRLFEAPRVVLMVASIGLAQLLFALSLFDLFRPDETRLVYDGYPVPINWSFDTGGYLLRGGEFMVLIFVPLATLGLAFLFRSTKMGMSIQAVASNSEAARLAGIRLTRVSTTVWIIAGVLSALTAILLSPFHSTVTVQALGPGLMVRALAAALAGSMSSLPRTFAAGVGLGVIEQVTFANFSRGGTTELVMFAALTLMLVWRANALGKVSRRTEDVFRVATTPRPLPADLVGRPAARVARVLGLGVLGLAAVVLPVLPGFDSQSRIFLATLTVAFAIIAVSQTVVTGWLGHLSLGQFAFAALGAVTAARLTPHGWSLPAVAIAGGVVAAAAAVLVGLPTLRVKGIFLAVGTLGFAVLTQGWLLNQGWVTGTDSSAVSVPRPRLPFIGEVQTNRGIYYLSLAVLVAVLSAVSGLNGSGLGRRLLAARDNARSAAAHGISPEGSNIVGFALAGFVAGVGGVVWGYTNPNFDSLAFSPSISLAVLTMVVIGGLGTISGAVAGAVVAFGIPLFLELGLAYTFLYTSLLLLAAVVFFPGGIVGALVGARDVAVRAIVGFLERPRSGSAADLGSGSAPALACDGVTVRFGGLTALDDVSLQVQPGEIVALIGSNGAGKTTLMDCISGFLRPASGQIRVNGRQVSHLGPEFRPYLGLARSFQDARLYPGMTVLETVKVALEREQHSGSLSSLLRAPWSRWDDREKSTRALEALELVGLLGYRDTRVGELPTGLRRLCDVATVLVQRPTVVLLDEPTAGMPKTEAHGLAPLLRRVHEELGCAMLVIEHDMGLVLSLADRIYALEAGRVIAEGRPDDVASDPRVVASYLGEVVGAGNGSHPSSAVGNGKRAGIPLAGVRTRNGPRASPLRGK